MFLYIVYDKYKYYFYFIKRYESNSKTFNYLKLRNYRIKDKNKQ